MNKKGDVVYFVFLKTKEGKGIDDMTPCITLKKAISHGVHLAKVYENVSSGRKRETIHSISNSIAHRPWRVSINTTTL